jgi:hypothetical protein
MKIISVLTILTIISFTNIFGQVNDTFKGDIPLIKNLKSIIESNRSELIYDLPDINFKSKIELQELETTINSINKLLKEHNIKGLNSIKNGSNSSVRYIDGKRTESLSSNYKIKPKYLNNNVSFLFKPLGYNIKIQVSKQNNKWLLSNLTLEDEYADSNYKMGAKIPVFLKNLENLYTRYLIVMDTQKLYYQGTMKSVDIGGLIINELEHLEHIKFSDLKDQKIFSDSSRVYSLSFFSKKEEASKLNFVNKEKTREVINMYEFIFYDNNTSLVLVSNGNKYAFYKVKSVKVLKEIILNKITEIAK